MDDYFVILGVSRRPWLDLDELKSGFLKSCGDKHPDRFPHATEEERQKINQEFARVNQAYQCLSGVKERLLHLLELELGKKPGDIQRMAPGTMDFFMEVGQLSRDVDAFLAEKAKVTSPTIKVKYFVMGMEWMDKLNALQQKVNAKRDELENELKLMNSIWVSKYSDQAEGAGTKDEVKLPLERLEQIYRFYSHTTRWTQQIQEHLVPLSSE